MNFFIATLDPPQVSNVPARLVGRKKPKITIPEKKRSAKQGKEENKILLGD